MKSVLTTLAILIVAAACGGTPTGTNSGDTLTNEEIQAILNQLSGSLGGVTSVPTLSVNGGTSAEPNLAVSVDPVNVNIDLTLPCQSGGNITLVGSVNGDIDPQTVQGSLEVDFAWGFDNCAFPAQATTVTIQGDPNIQFSGTFTFGQDVFSMTGSLNGGFSFATADGRTGSCAIDLTFDTTVNSATGAVSGAFNGSVCGVAASGFQTFGGTS